MEELNGVLDLLNALDMPSPVNEFIDDLSGSYSFYDDLFTIYRKLEAMPVVDKKSDFYKEVFMSIVSYYTMTKYPRLSVKCLKSINKALIQLPNVVRKKTEKEAIYGILLGIKYRIVKLKRSLFLVDSWYDKEVFFRSIRDTFSNNVRIRTIRKFNEIKFKQATRQYDQLYIFGHGDDRGSDLGGKNISASWLKEVLSKSDSTIKVLGLFSCQRNLNTSTLKNAVDYLITDSSISSPDYTEMFLFGFFQNYLKSWRIKDSFEIGGLAPIFRASANIRMELYERGLLVSRR